MLAPDQVDDESRDPRFAAQAAALEAIFRASYEDLHVTAYPYLRSIGLAEEVVQDVFLAMWERRDRWGEGEVLDLRRYLFRAVQNRAVSLLRRERLEAGTGERVEEGRAETGAQQSTVAPDQQVDRSPRFAKRYVELGHTITEVFAAYAADVRAGRFPAPEHCYPMDPDAEAEIRGAREAVAVQPVESPP